jgi:hypothetical protein
LLKGISKDERGAPSETRSAKWRAGYAASAKCDWLRSVSDLQELTSAALQAAKPSFSGRIGSP